MRHNVVFALLCTIALLGQEQVGGAPCKVTDQGRRSDAILRHLERIGVDPADEVVLVRELHNPRGGVLAAYALGWRPKTGNTVKALQDASRNAHEAIAAVAFASLCRLGTTEWVSDAERRVTQFSGAQSIIGVGALLALNGSDAGWLKVRQLILTSESEKSPAYHEAMVRFPMLVTMPRRNHAYGVDLWNSRAKAGDRVRQSLESVLPAQIPELRQQ